MKLTLMTYNIAAGRDYRNMPEIKYNPEACIAVIHRFAPDILGLNEVDYEMPRSQKEHLAEKLGDALQMYWYFAPALELRPDGRLVQASQAGKGNYGNALLSRFPILSAETILVDEPPHGEGGRYEPRSVLRAVLNVKNDRKITVIVTHFGLEPEERAETVALLKRLLSDSEMPTILMGDFNVEPEDTCLRPIYEQMQDTFDKIEDPMTKTFPTFELKTYSVVETEKPIKIDYIFVSKEFSVKKTIVPTDEKASDHRPYISECELS